MRMNERMLVSYQLVIEVPAPVRCVVGRLGEVEFPAGVYVYTGSARRDLEARIARHLRPNKKLVRVAGFGASDCLAGCGAHLKYRGSPD
jgi:Uri superfamily endonuclease